MDKYLLICEQLGQEPDPDKMPLDTSDFPEEVQVAFFVFNMLSDVFEGMSGSYMGKNWVDCEFICKAHNIDNVKTVLYFAKLYERILMNHRADEANKKQKANERKAKAGGGQNYTHNVKG
jgi:hypothetical protein